MLGRCFRIAIAAVLAATLSACAAEPAAEAYVSPCPDVRVISLDDMTGGADDPFMPSFSLAYAVSDLTEDELDAYFVLNGSDGPVLIEPKPRTEKWKARFTDAQIQEQSVIKVLFLSHETVALGRACLPERCWFVELSRVAVSGGGPSDLSFKYVLKYSSQAGQDQQILAQRPVGLSDTFNNRIERDELLRRASEAIPDHLVALRGC